MAVQFVCYGKAVHILGAIQIGALMMLAPLFGKRKTIGLGVAFVCIVLGVIVGSIFILSIKRSILRGK